MAGSSEMMTVTALIATMYNLLISAKDTLLTQKFRIEWTYSLYYYSYRSSPVIIECGTKVMHVQLAI